MTEATLRHQDAHGLAPWTRDSGRGPRNCSTEARRLAPRLSPIGSSGREDWRETVGTERDHDQLAISPSHVGRREVRHFPSADVELIDLPGVDRLHLRSHSSRPRVLFFEKAVRDLGDTFVEGANRSNLGDQSGRYCVAPAGHELSTWAIPKGASRLLLVAFLPEAFAQSSAALACPALMPQVDVESSQVRNTLSKLADVARQSDPFSMLYGNALASLLAAEIFYNQAGPAITRSGRFARGGLAGWQERQARDYIQSHLSEEIRIDHLARMVRLSVFHFCRAFKCTFGIPPHKYQLARRVEQAKELLIGSSLPVTSIAFRLGFGGTSQFSTVFRKMTGTTPTSYRRRLGLGEPDCVGEGDANSPPETASG